MDGSYDHRITHITHISHKEHSNLYRRWLMACGRLALIEDAIQQCNDPDLRRFMEDLNAERTTCWNDWISRVRKAK